MHKLILLTLFVSTTSFAHTLMLHKHVTSGNVQPEDSFTKDCKVYREGFAVIRKKMGTHRTRIHSHNVSQRRVLLIRTLLRQAKDGTIATVGATCDGGDQLLHGYYKGNEFILDVNEDCGEHKVNQSPATPFLASQTESICGF